MEEYALSHGVVVGGGNVHSVSEGNHVFYKQ